LSVQVIAATVAQRYEMDTQMQGIDAPSSPLIVPILLTDAQAAACLGVSPRKFHELRDEPWMPKAVQLGPRALRWARAELEEAIARMPRLAATGQEPAALRRARIENLKTRGVPASAHDAR
jgi:predicted DNA-binding transcriptional regulator AlpA